jgi:hypothetical protein
VELEAAARRALLGDATVAGYVQTRVYKYRLQTKLEGTSQSAVVVARNNGWASSLRSSAVEFPILAVRCYADPARDGDGTILELDAEDRAFGLYRAVDRVLHWQREYQMGGYGSNAGLTVVSSQRHGEPMLVTDKDRHGMGDPLGDVVYALGQWAFEVVH